MHARHVARLTGFQQATESLSPGKFLSRGQSLRYCKRRADLSSRRSSTPQETSPYTPITLDPADNGPKLEASCQFLAQHLETWLNEEWAFLDLHHGLALEAAKAYRDVRLQGEDELGSVLLGVSMRLLAFDFRDTFVDAYEVSNKVAELLMLHEDREVCCRSEADEECYERVERENRRL